MDIKNVYAGITTKDIESASLWYEEFFGRKADYNPMNNLYEWDFLEGGVLQLFEDLSLAGKSSITLMVDDIDAVKDTLTKKDFTLERETESDVARTITINDPEGNKITFAENLQGR